MTDRRERIFDLIAVSRIRVMTPVLLNIRANGLVALAANPMRLSPIPRDKRVNNLVELGAILFGN